MAKWLEMPERERFELITQHDGHTLRFDWHHLDIDLIVLDLPPGRPGCRWYGSDRTQGWLGGPVKDLVAACGAGGEGHELPPARVCARPCGRAGASACRRERTAAPRCRDGRAEATRSRLARVRRGQAAKATCAGVLGEADRSQGAGLRGHLGIPSGVVQIDDFGQRGNCRLMAGSRVSRSTPE